MSFSDKSMEDFKDLGRFMDRAKNINSKITSINTVYNYKEF